MDLSAFGSKTMYDGMKAYLSALSMVPPERPKALLVISAHWEEPEPTLMTSDKPPMFYDYYGFPPETYELQWPAPGAPDVAHEVVERLGEAGIRTGLAAERGFDHGAFVPLMIAWPEADVPTLQISLKEGLDPVEHLALGRALAPLRQQGVFLIGSGMSYHNMQGFFGRVPTVADDSKAFDDWMAEAVAADPSVREQRLAEWARAPRARACHPREEHLLPLMVCAGAAEDDAGSTPYRDVVMNAHVSAVHFG
jgi:aromatic ring-opening dioxygenase catalytic subunit (LigB family)